MNPTALEIVFEDIPASPPRAPGKGREPVKWEEHLAPLKEAKNEDGTPRSARIWTYDEKSSATSRLASVSKRLADATPEDNWELKVREVPEGDAKGKHGVYVAYHGTHSAEQVKVNADLRAKRSQAAKDRLAKAAQEAASADGGDTEGEVAPEAATPKQTAAQKVAAAKAAKAK